MVVSEVQNLRLWEIPANQEIHFYLLIKHKYWTKMRNEFTSYCKSLFCESFLFLSLFSSDAFIIILIFMGGFMMFVNFFRQDLRWWFSTSWATLCHHLWLFTKTSTSVIGKNVTSDISSVLADSHHILI